VVYTGERTPNHTKRKRSMTTVRKGIARAPVKAIDQALMLSLFTYAETTESGEIFWKANRTSNARAGDRAGYLGGDKYWRVKVNGVKYKLHRVIYTMIKGPIAEGKVINHLDENKSNNKIENLEAVTPADNNNWGTRNARVSKPIYCHETGVTYPSINQAARELNLHATNISSVLNGRQKYTGNNLTFSYYVTTATNTATD